MYVNRNMLMGEKAAELQKDLAEWAQETNILAIGEQLYVEIAIVPVPDVVVTIRNEEEVIPSKVGRTGKVSLDSEDWQLFQNTTRLLRDKKGKLKSLLLKSPGGVLESDAGFSTVSAYAIRDFNRYLQKKGVPFLVERDVVDDTVMYKVYKLVS